MIKVGGNLFMPILLFPPPRFHNSKIGIGKSWHKLAKIGKNWQNSKIGIGINRQKLKTGQKLINRINCALGIFFENIAIFRPKCETWAKKSNLLAWSGHEVTRFISFLSIFAKLCQFLPIYAELAIPTPSFQNSKIGNWKKIGINRCPPKSIVSVMFKFTFIFFLRAVNF